MSEWGFDVVGLGDTDSVEVGEKAPDFTRPLVDGEDWVDTSLSSVLDGLSVLVFYPMNGSFPATYIWKEIDSRSWGVDIFGVSISTPYSHRNFIYSRGLDYRFFSDPSNKVAEQYGVVHDLDGMDGIKEPRPAVYILDKDRKVRYRWIATEWPDFPDYDEIEEKINSLY